MDRSSRSFFALPLILAVFGLSLEAAPAYFPPSGKWQKKAPAELGMDPAKLQQAIDYAKANGSTWDFDKDQVRTFGAVVGPLPKERAATNDNIHSHSSPIA